MALTLGAVELGAEVVSGHTSSFLGAVAQQLHLPDTLSEVVEAGHSSGVQYLCWCPSLTDCTALVAADVDAVRVDDVPTMLPALRLLRRNIVEPLLVPDQRDEQLGQQIYWG